MLTDQTRIGIPDRYEIENAGGIFQIRWKWWRVVAIPLLVFSLAWDSFLVSWYMGALAGGNPSLLMLIFPIGHVAVGVAILYIGIAFLVNSTTVSIGSGQIVIRHAPLPWAGNKTIQTTQIRQLFCCERSGRKSRSYEVMVRLTSDREVSLLSGLASEREARFLEQRIEERLGLPDTPVAGELSR